MKTMLTQGFADIHTHLLPETDDGAQDLQDALQLARLAYDSGTRDIFLTSHYRAQYRKNTPQVLRERFEIFQKAAAEEFPDLKLHLGSEIHYQVDVFQKVMDGEVLSLNGSRYVLLEFGGGDMRSRVMAGVLEAVQYGYVPIIAHVEFCAALVADGALREEVMDMGALFQINADTLLGNHGFKLKQFCHRMLKKRQVHFVASDCHDSRFRPPQLDKAYRRVQKKYGEEYADRIFGENARVVIENRTFD